MFITSLQIICRAGDFLELLILIPKSSGATTIFLPPLSERLVWKKIPSYITGLGLSSMFLTLLKIPQNFQDIALKQGLFSP